MKELLSLLRARPILTAELLVASLLINVLGLTPPLFFILVFNRYVNSGFDGTLITLTTGMVLAVALKFVFGLARNRLAEEVSGERDPLRMVQAFQILLRARVASLARQSRTQVMEAVQAPQVGQSACSPRTSPRCWMPPSPSCPSSSSSCSAHSLAWSRLRHSRSRRS